MNSTSSLRPSWRWGDRTESVNFLTTGLDLSVNMPYLKVLQNPFVKTKNVPILYMEDCKGDGCSVRSRAQIQMLTKDFSSASFYKVSQEPSADIKHLSVLLSLKQQPKLLCLLSLFSVDISNFCVLGSVGAP